MHARGSIEGMGSAVTSWIPAVVGELGGAREGTTLNDRPRAEKPPLHHEYSSALLLTSPGPRNDAE